MDHIYKILKNINSNKKFFNQTNMPHYIMFNITNVCNLNCTNCSLGCGKRTPFFVKFEDFKQQILKLSQIIPHIGHITLIGGEPMLHPNLLDMCEFISLNIACERIIILSNGVLSDKISDEELLKYKKYNVHFLFTLYPRKELINKISTFEKRCQQFQIPFEIHGVRPCFGIPDFNKNGTNNKEAQFYQCEKSSTPHTFVTFDGKLYNCCLMPSYPDMNLPMDNNDYIQIKDIKSFNQILDLANRPYEGCKYCQLSNTIGEPLHFWHTQDEVPSSDPFKQMYELYLDDYNHYYQLCHTYGEIKECLQDEYFLSKQNFEDHLTSKPIKQYQKRFFNGKADIFIPFNNNNYKSIISLKNYLIQQKDIDKYNIYFVSENASREIEKEIYFTYPPLQGFNNISILFLKTQNYLNSFEAFYNNSFLEKIILINSKEDYQNLQKDMNYINNKYLYMTLDRNKITPWTFEFPYNFDKKLIEILNILEGNKNNTIHCIYLPPLLKDYPSILRTGEQANLLNQMSEKEYISHIQYINNYFPNKIQLLLQKTDYILNKEKIEWYHNLGINKFCVGTIEQAKIIKEVNPKAEIIGSINMHITKKDLETNNELEKYFMGFVLDFSFGRKYNEIVTLPNKFKYIILVNSYCNNKCDGTHHWMYQYKKNSQEMKCPGILQDKSQWNNSVLIRPMDLKLWYPYISIFKIQDRGWPTADIIKNYILYTSDYNLYPGINYDINIYN